MSTSASAFVPELDLQPTVTVAIPVLDEAEHLETTLDSIRAQTYPFIMEVIVVDGGSTDHTREIARGYEGLAIRLVDNPGRAQAPALNIALREARGELFVRVDGHCALEPDYVASCVDAINESGAAIVGGGMSPEADGLVQRGIARAMTSRLGAGPARFHTGGPAGWVDTVYLGAFPTELARMVGGYAEDVGVNEDAELAIRMGRMGGVWFDPAIRSHYAPRKSLVALARQFYRYGHSRALTVRHHPETLRPRQMVPPLFVLAIASPWRKPVLTVYGAGILARTALEATRDPRSAPGFAASLPTMHVAWGVGFIVGAAGARCAEGRRT
jgi:glycosyltransferase involved in cell wall biosynthesis